MIKQLLLASVLTLPLTGCAYDMVRSENVQSLREVSKEIGEEVQELKDRKTFHELNGDKEAASEAAHGVDVLNAIQKPICALTGDAVPADKFIIDRAKEVNKAIPTPYGAYVDMGLNILGGLTLLGGGAYAGKKGHRILTRKARIEDAKLEVKESPVGGQGIFDPCSPEILHAMRLTLDADDYKHYVKYNNCV